MPSPEWFRQWFGEDYVKIYGHRDKAQAEAQVSMLLSHIHLATDSIVLDCASGNGRHLQALRKRGIRSFGMDLSEWLLGSCACSGLVVRADWRNPPFTSGKFDLVCSFFTSFGYLESREADFGAFRSLLELVRNQGWFFLDLINPSSVAADRLQQQEFLQLEKMEVNVQRWRDDNVVCKRMQWLDAQGNSQEHTERVRVYSVTELEPCFTQCGFEVEEIFGNEYGDAWTLDSPRLSLLLRKVFP